MVFDWTLAVGLVITATLIAMASLAAISALALRQAPTPVSVFSGPVTGTVFLFDGEALVDATPEGRALLAGALASGGPWFRLLARLEPLFPGLTPRLDGLGREGGFLLSSAPQVDPPLLIRAESLGGLTRLTLLEGGDRGAAQVAAAAQLAVEAELALLRQIVNHAPVPVWRTSAGGEVIWANAPYLDAAAALLPPGRELPWPLPRLFDTAGLQPVRTAERRLLRLPDALHWYDVISYPDGPDQLHYALPADRLVQAETSLRDFMQTLTKTFAQLPIGLAIFDRNRVLQMFNPALIDLTGAPAEFLIARPTLALMLDHMREGAMIPEPRDYRSWRRQIVEMEEAAASGLFEETWSLPSGRTYRVTGRPHPNGALAFMIEDISTEVSRTRRYRADLELGQAVIDAMADAVVVFAQDGAVAMTNTGARRLWGDEIATTFSERGEPAAVSLWRQMTAPTLLWNDLAVFIGSFAPREPWEGEVRLTDGRLLECRVSPLPQGSTLVVFRSPVPRGVAAGGEEQAIMIA
ncbi:PAS-domain containing protein [Neotabrizicola sp. VNH66]|uniref:PAS-domain containing protein n=1 Tax=Neotabrizicola sp. VNH66 TaxID=3400918 RepID=UPI003C0CD317